jgi:serine/threonine protein kinase/TPR repeat protein
MPDAERYQQYEVLRREDGSLWELGRGAMGITYKAFDTNLHCPVALKVINSTYLRNETARQRFLREARAAAALRHPNVASVFNLSTDQENYFYVMEFIDGETVDVLVRRKERLETFEALNITLQVARALAAAAKQRLVHRDLKPSNLMLVDDEAGSVVKVIDFGLAKTTKDSTEETAALTMDGFVGTPHFASPEQVEEGDLDVRSDIYSLGATLYFMLTGKAPFSGSVGQVMSQHLYKPVPLEPLAGQQPCVVALIQKMLQKDRAKRPQTARQLQDEIVHCLAEISASPPRSLPEADLTPTEPLRTETFYPQNYRVIEQIGEISVGKYFLVEDLRRKRLVRQLVLRPELVADLQWFTTLEAVVGRLRNAPHHLLRAVYSLEIAGGEGVIVEEHIAGSILRDLLRARGVFSAPEVARLISLLAPLADHANAHHLEYVDFSLFGIHRVAREPTATGSMPDTSSDSLMLQGPRDLRVDGIDFSFASPQAGTLIGFQTQVQTGTGNATRGGYLKALSLLAYELLGGGRVQTETTGQYKPVAALTQEGNAVLRRGVANEWASAAELARELVAAIGPRAASPDTRETKAAELTQEVPIIEEDPTSISVNKPRETSTRVVADLTTVTPSVITTAPRPKKALRLGGRRLGLILGLIVILAIGGYLIYWQLSPGRQAQELAALSVQTDPVGASILLDGKPPQKPPNTFTHVPFGAHRLTATLDNFQPAQQDIQVRQDTAPAIHLKLAEKPEIPALSVITDPPGATVLLDGKALPKGSNTFTHVPYGPHHLTAMLSDYESVEQKLDVSRGMRREIQIKLVRKTTPIEVWLADVKKSRENSPQQLNAYVHLTQLSTPDSSDYRKALEHSIEQLRTRTPPISPAEFALSYQSIIKEAADLDVLPAILWLAENENGSEALSLYLRAAKLGSSYAMMKVGRLYLRKATPADNEEGFKWLNQAYNAPDPNLEAGAYIGDCYLSGIGTQRDLQMAEEIIMPLAKQNVVPAMTIAGKILAIKVDDAITEAEKTDLTPQDRRELEAKANELAHQATAWWTRAVEKGDWNASAHLGQCYELGWGGIQKDEAEAERRYKDGVDHGNAISMFFYALLINKRPGRHAEAVNWISRAAAAGLPSAVKWCKENNVPVADSGKSSE